MGFKHSYQIQSSYFEQNLVRDNMHFFWFVYLTGRIKNLQLFVALFVEQFLGLIILSSVYLEKQL